MPGDGRAGEVERLPNRLRIQSFDQTRAALQVQCTVSTAQFELTGEALRFWKIYILLHGIGIECRRDDIPVVVRSR